VIGLSSEVLVVLAVVMLLVVLTVLGVLVPESIDFQYCMPT